MSGNDIPLPDFQISIHAPTVKEIAFMGENRFFTAAQYLCLDKKSLTQDETLLSAFSNFQVLMKVLEQSEDKEKKKSIIMLLKLLFPSRQAAFTKNSIILVSQEQGQDPIMIDDSNFDGFQDVVKQVLCINSLFQGNNIVYNPQSRRAKEIADKIMRGRRKVAELKHQGSNESVLTRYVSILSVGIQSMSLQDILSLNLFQIFDLMERYNAYLEWDIDLRVRLAGGKPDKEIESWMRDLHPN